MTVTRMYAVFNIQSIPSIKLVKLIPNMYWVWLYFSILSGKNPLMVKMTKSDTYSEAAHRACSNELFGRNALTVKF